MQISFTIPLQLKSYKVGIFKLGKNTSEKVPAGPKLDINKILIKVGDGRKDFNE